MLKKRNRFAQVVGAILMTTACYTNHETPVETLRFSAIPDQNTTELQEKFQPLVDYLSQQLGVPVEYVPSRDYQATVEMFKNGDILLAWFGGLTGVQARSAVQGAKAIVQGDTDPQFYSYFVAHRSTGLSRKEEFPMEIGNFKFTFGSESSTSGRLMPEYFIREHTGKAPAEFFSFPVAFSGSHDKTAELVEKGQYEVGVMNYAVYDRRVSEGTTNPAVVRIIWKTPTYVDYHWIAHPRMDQAFGNGFMEKIQQTLIGITDIHLLAALPRERLIPAADQDYEQLRRVAEQLGIEPGLGGIRIGQGTMERIS
jgi:phosphonate transport system substrate-binding protein